MADYQLWALIAALFGHAAIVTPNSAVAVPAWIICGSFVLIAVVA